MSENKFTDKNVIARCVPMSKLQSVIGGKWKIIMIYMLQNGALRSSDLQRKMSGVSNKMFTQTARELEYDGIVKREVFPVVPPRVEYSLTPIGQSILPIVRDIAEWGKQLLNNKL